MQNYINSWSYGVVLYEIFTLGMYLASYYYAFAHPLDWNSFEGYLK